MKPLFLLLSILAMLPTSLAAQVNRSGTPIVTTVEAMETSGDPLNLCITMDNRGVMFFGNQSKGVLTYDGLSWKQIPLNRPQRINALASDYRGVVYVGGTNDFGFLQPDIKGDLKYESFADRITDSLTRSDIRAVMSIATDSSKVYFADRSKLWIYDFLSDTLSLVNLNQELNLRSTVNVIVRDNRVFIADSRRGLFEYKEGQISLLPQGDMIRGVRFIALLPCGKDQILIVTRENGVYLYNYNSGEVNASFLSDIANTRLKEGLVSSAAIISGNRIAIGVEGGEGIYIYDFNGVLKQQISTGTAHIPRSAVTSMYCDYTTNSQLWFCTTGCINRAYVSLPVSEFGFGAGIVSDPGDIIQFNGDAYCSCDSGVYRSFTDKEGHFRFALLEGFDRKTLDLQKIRNTNKEVLIASTESGLFKVDTTGEVRIVFNNLFPTTIKVDRENSSVIVAGSNRGIVSWLQFSGDRFIRINSTQINDIEGSATNLEQSPESEWWVLTKNPSTLYRIQESNADTSFIWYGSRSGLRSDRLNQVVTIDTNLYVCTGNGIYRYNRENELFEKDLDLIGESFGDAEVLMIMKTPEGDIYVAGRDTRFFDAIVTRTSHGHVVFRKQFDILPDIPTTDIEYIDGNIWIVKGKSLYVINKGRLGYNYGSFNTIFTNIVAGRNLLLMNGSFYKEEVNGIKVPLLSQPQGSHPRLSYSMNDISFSWTTTCYIGEERTEYRYKLEGFDHEWSSWGNHNFKEFTNLPPGHYQFRIRSSTITGLGGEETTFSFSVLNPWYRTYVAVTLYILTAFIIFYYIIRIYTRRLRKEKIYLAKLLKQQRAEMTRQKEELETGIRYAGRILAAHLPDGKLLDDSTSNYFILYRPIEQASGDFYWIARKDDRLFVAAADCTGHGVQGAALSLLGISLLNSIINRPGVHNASQVLTELRNEIAASFNKSGDGEVQKDNIKIALLVFDYSTGVVEFSGAYNPCFKVRALNSDETDQWEAGGFITEEGSVTNGKYLLETVGASKIAVGLSRKTNQDFKQQEWELGNEDSYYLFTDGYMDQFNGITGKKFLKKNLKKLLLDLQNFPMARQKEILEERLNSWMGSAAQLDDILIIGIKP